MSGHKTLALFVLGLLLSVKVSGLGVHTHRLVNRQAAEASDSFKSYLRTGLGFPDSIDTSVHGKTIRDWLEEGGHREDDLLRALRHFHDPLKPWETAGLNLGIDRHDSSVRWMQQRSQGGASTGGFWSWRDARRLYYEALTEPDPVRRQALWADLFRALGQIMHLVVDASVPEHARNDVHLLGALKLGNSYERWVGGQHDVGNSQSEAQFIARYLSAPIGFVSDTLQLPSPAGETIAKVPVARLIDADRYDGTNPSITVDGADPRAPVSAGLAEIANANFFSESTLRGQYPSPTDEGLIPINLATPLGRVRRYFSRPEGQGLLPANPLRAECAGDAYYHRGQIGQPAPYPCTDEVVWQQVAAHMLPRAVGYARGVLDYFFRGTLQVNRVFWQGGGSPGIHISVTNLTNEELDGAFTVYARLGSEAEERHEWVASVAGGDRVQLGPGATATLPLTLREGSGASGAQLLVFRGRLGLEDEAVIGQVFTVPYVFVLQDRHETDLQRECTNTVITREPFESRQAGLQVLRLHHARCSYVPVNQRMSGVIYTNARFSQDAEERQPAIAAIDAFWRQGLNRFPAPLALDGVTAQGGAWRRTGSEPDPTTFEIYDPAPHRQRAELMLSVRLVSGETILTGLAGFGEAFAGHLKQLRAHFDGASWAYLTQSDRGASMTVISNYTDVTRPRFEVVSVAGVPNPTDTFQAKLFRGFSLPGEGTRVSQAGQSNNHTVFQESVSDDFKEHGHGALPVALGDYEAIGPMLAPHPSGPPLRWEAVVKPVYDPNQLAFLGTFLMEDLDAHEIVLTGLEPDP